MNTIMPTLRYPFGNGQVLVIDTFNDSYCINGAEGDKELPVRSLSDWKIEAQRAYEADIAERQSALPLQFIICPTYSCNMRCGYCYQQNDPTLSKELMSEETLEKILCHIVKEVDRRRTERPSQKVVIQMFGGEPFQARIKPLNRRIFQFAREHGFYLAATSNGVEIDEHMDLLIPFHGYVSCIAVTIDGDRETHDRRRRYRPGSDNYDRIVRNINLLLRLNIPVSVGMNVDRLNQGALGPFLDLCDQQGWNNNRLVTIEIGRVDDQEFERDESALLTETELLKRLIELNRSRRLPGNIRLAFLKTTFALARKLGLSFNQAEAGRARYHYCWATSPTNHTFYIDARLDIYRCTYTVGDRKHRCGNLDSGIRDADWYRHRLFDKPECLACPLGGYCSGGCRLSDLADCERKCSAEKSNFDRFVHEIMIPLLEDRHAQNG